VLVVVFVEGIDKYANVYRRFMPELSTTFAYVLPLPLQVISRIFEDGRTVIVKFWGPDNRRNRLGIGTLLLFYQSGGAKSVIGEATIKKIEIGGANELLSQYGKKLILDKTELEQYIKKFPGREEKQLVALEILSPIRYDKPFVWAGSMTMMGKNLTKKEYISFFGS